ncbi:MAG: hypothetical protein ACHQ51_14855 [Elusimicrobiota bacterium]
MNIAADGGMDLYDLVMRDLAAAPAATRAGGVSARDLTVVLAAAAKGRQPWRAAELARELGLSPLDVSLGLERARRVGLVDEEKRRVLKEPLLEFLVHGLRYVFPAELGSSGPGTATAQLAGRYVWPLADGESHGRHLTPLDPAALRAVGAARELLGLVDVLRIGHVWERTIAVREIARRLDSAS